MGPGWVRDGDGRLAPFDIERLSRRLFRVARGLGPADPVLLRELAEAVGLFIGQEAIPGKAMPAADFIDAVARGARRLGQPAIADAWLVDHGMRDAGEHGWPDEGLGPDLAELEDRGSLALGGSARPMLADARIDISAMSAAEAVTGLVERSRLSRGPFHLVGWDRLLASGAAASGELAALMGPLADAAFSLDRPLCLHLPGPWHLDRAARDAEGLFALERRPGDLANALNPLMDWLKTADRPVAVTAHAGARDRAEGKGWRRSIARLARPDRPVRVMVGSREAGPAWPAADQPAVLGRARVNLGGETDPRRRDMLARLAVAAGARWRDSVRRTRCVQGDEARWPGIWGLERCCWLVELRGAPVEEWHALEAAIGREAGKAGITVVVSPGPEQLPRVAAGSLAAAGAWPRGGCLVVADGEAPEGNSLWE